ncbi:hypothetical protein [Sporisorium scitamineum]|nr:hypothetical protein [Sporisorium scitamineum]
MLDEHEAAKARRAQLEFCKERDVETFLSLIEPDSTLLPSGGSAMVKSQKEKGKEKAQSLLMRRTESGINERRNKEEYKAVVAHEASQSESQSQSLGEKLLQLNQTRLGQSLASAPGSSSFSLLSQGQHLNYRTPTESCLLHNAHPERVESSTTTPLIEDARQMLSSSSGSLMGVYSGPVSTPLTEATELTNLADEHSLFEPSEQEEAVDDGLSGWPDPSAVECIQDDVCRLCLTDSDLERVIERGVEEHLQDMEG